MKRQNFKRVKTSDGVVLKSGLEEAVYNFLNKVKVNFIYEGMKIVYFQPEIKKTYTPDFPIQNSQLVIETKGAFNSADRKKMKTIKAQNPNLDIRFIFSNSKTKIGKKSKRLGLIKRLKKNLVKDPNCLTQRKPQYLSQL